MILKRTSAIVLGCFRPNDCHAVFQSPRCLIVHIHTPILHLFVAVVHAPHSQDPQCTEWWEEFPEIIERLTHADSVVYLMDANARICQEVPPFSGDLIDDRPNKATDLLHGFLEKQMLFVPSTFSWHHWGRHLGSPFRT